MALLLFLPGGSAGRRADFSRLERAGIFGRPGECLFCICDAIILFGTAISRIMDCFYVVLGIGAWGITVVLSWLGAKSRCRIEGKPFIWYYTAGIWASLFGLAVTGVMLAVSIV